MEKVVDYIPYLRSFVGHREILTVGLSALIVDEKEEFLLEKRSDNGLYCRPGGSLDLGETVLEGVVREVREETGIVLDPKEGRLFQIRSGDKAQIHYPNGDVTDYVDLVFLFRVSSAVLDPSALHDQESVSIAFYPEERLPHEEETLPGTMDSIRKYLRKDFSVTVD